MAAVTGHHDWEPIASNAQGHDMVERMRVPGGWLYRNMITDTAYGAGGLRLVLVFVPLSSNFPQASAGQEPH